PFNPGDLVQVRDRPSLFGPRAICIGTTADLAAPTLHARQRDREEPGLVHRIGKSLERGTVKCNAFLLAFRNHDWQTHVRELLRQRARHEVEAVPAAGSREVLVRRLRLAIPNFERSPVYTKPLQMRVRASRTVIRKDDSAVVPVRLPSNDIG